MKCFQIQLPEAVARSCSVKKDFLKNFAILTEKHQCWSLFLTLLKETQTQVFFSVNIVEFLRTSFYRAPLMVPSKPFHWKQPFR